MVANEVKLDEEVVGVDVCEGDENGGGGGDGDAKGDGGEHAGGHKYLLGWLVGGLAGAR